MIDLKKRMQDVAHSVALFSSRATDAGYTIHIQNDACPKKWGKMFEASNPSGQWVTMGYYDTNVSSNYRLIAAYSSLDAPRVSLEGISIDV